MPISFHSPDAAAVDYITEQEIERGTLLTKCFNTHVCVLPSYHSSPLRTPSRPNPGPQVCQSLLFMHCSRAPQSTQPLTNHLIHSSSQDHLFPTRRLSLSCSGSIHRNRNWLPCCFVSSCRAMACSRRCCACHSASSGLLTACCACPAKQKPTPSTQNSHATDGLSSPGMERNTHKTCLCPV